MMTPCSTCLRAWVRFGTKGGGVGGREKERERGGGEKIFLARAQRQQRKKENVEFTKRKQARCDLLKIMYQFTCTLITFALRGFRLVGRVRVDSTSTY
jgi:hypothetical protein